MKTNLMLKLTALVALTAFYALGSQPIPAAPGAAQIRATAQDTCVAGNGATCNCAGTCSAGATTCKCDKVY
jgi:hypothetical protein